MSLLKQNTIKKEQLDKIMFKFEFDNGKKKKRKYEIKAIRDRRVFTRKSDNYLPGLYYLLS